MERQFLFNHPVRGLSRALLLSLALHATVATAIALFSRSQASIGSPRIVTLDLAELNDNPIPVSPGPVSEAKRTTTLTRPATATVPPPMAVGEKLPEEQPPKPLSPEPRMNPSSLSLGMTRGFFRSLADGDTLRSDIKEYYFALVQRINEQWWAVADQRGTEPGRQEALVTIVLQRDGEILDVRLIKSSGNPEYDRVILKALQSATPLPPLPESYPGEYFEAPFRLMAPLGLLS